MKKRIEIILHRALICMILVMLFSGFASAMRSRVAAEEATEKGSMNAFRVQLYCADQSGHTVDAEVEVTGNGNYVLSGVIPENWLGSIKYLYLDTNLYNGSTTQDFLLEVKKMSVGDSHNFYPTGSKGIWQLIGSDEKNFVYQLINPDVYFVGADLQTRRNDSEKGIDEFEKYQISMLRGNTVSVSFTVSGMDPNEQRVTYAPAPSGSTDIVITPPPTDIVITPPPSNEYITEENNLREKLDSIQCKVSNKKVVLSDKVKVKSEVKISWTHIKEASGYTVYRSTKKNSDYKEITKKVTIKGNTVSYTDSGVTKGKTYYYKIEAFGTLNGKTIVGSASSTKKITVTKSLSKPSIKCSRKGNILTITFHNMEGSGYQTQYHYLDEKGWKQYKKLTGKIKKSAKITLTSDKTLRKIGFALRVRTYMKVNGKTVYSSWSSAKNIKG